METSDIKNDVEARVAQRREPLQKRYRAEIESAAGINRRTGDKGRVRSREKGIRSCDLCRLAAASKH